MPAGSVMVKGKVVPVHQASLVVGLTASVAQVLGFVSAIATCPHSNPLSIVETANIVTSRLWNGDCVYSYAPGYSRGL